MTAGRIPSGKKCSCDQIGSVAARLLLDVVDGYSRVSCCGDALLYEFRYRSIDVTRKRMRPHVEVYPFGDEINDRWPFPCGQLAIPRVSLLPPVGRTREWAEL